MGSVILLMSRPNLKFKNFQWGFGVESSFYVQVEKFQSGLGMGHLTMSRHYLKLNIFGEGGDVILPCPGQIWNLKFMVRMGWSVTFPCPGQIWNLKFLVRVGGSVILPCPGQIWYLNFSEGLGVDHLSMSRPNLKFKIFSEGCWVSHLTMSRPNLKFNSFSEGWGIGHLPCPGQIWNLKFSVIGGGFSHLSMSRSKSEI